MEHQIILLPRKDYWSWIKACKDYVMTFRATMTHNPVTAARHMAPKQTVTLVTGGDHFPEYGDILIWFKLNHANVKLDPIQVLTPGELKQILTSRLNASNRYGWEELDIRLQWPTEFPMITQSFGSNPQIYGEQGLPGHEGVDFRALMGSRIYCCANGTVLEVHRNPSDHKYGVFVRVGHEGGYRTTYAHLMQAKATQGQVVSAGDIIGLADTTGASCKNHLHLTMQKDGATERGETDYPNDEIDPTPYLVWPDSADAKSVKSFVRDGEQCLIGVHGRIDGPLVEEDFNVIEKAKLEAVKISLRESKENIERLRSIHPGMLLVARIHDGGSNGDWRAASFLSRIEIDVGRLYRLGVKEYELHANPNLFAGGWGRGWQDGKAFGEWFLTVITRLKELYPEARFGFPGLSPGGMLIGHRMGAIEFLDGAESAAMEADWIGVNCHWTDTESMMSIQGGRAYEDYRLRFPRKLLMVTDFRNIAVDISDSQKADEYLDFYAMIRRGAGIRAAFSYALSASDGHDSVVW
ncbi:MAG: M23 family metallopeptidase, partial [Anaerolineales bacterium]